MKTLSQKTQALIDSGLNELELAKMAGTSQPQINRIRRAVTKNPGYDLGRRLDELYTQLANHSAA